MKKLFLVFNLLFCLLLASCGVAGKNDNSTLRKMDKENVEYIKMNLYSDYYGIYKDSYIIFYPNNSCVECSQGKVFSVTNYWETDGKYLYIYSAYEAKKYGPDDIFIETEEVGLYHKFVWDGYTKVESQTNSYKITEVKYKQH